MEQTYHPEQLLREGQTIQFSPTGYSMYPFINPKKQTQVIVAPLHAERLRRGDVVLYRRTGNVGETDEEGFARGILTLHRIWKVKNGQYFMVGDNQKQVEGPILQEQILGKMTALVQRDKTCPVTNPFYIIKTRLWLFLRPFRPTISQAVAKLKRNVHR